MKVKYSVIPFVPAFLAMLALKLMSVFGVDASGRFMGMNSMNITYTVIGIAVGLFVVCVLINLFDRKTAPAYPVKKNVAAGLFALLSGVGIISCSLLVAVNAWADKANTENILVTIICAALAVPAGIAMMVMAFSHFRGNNTVSSVSALFVFPSLWGCAELVNEFLQATKASISSKDLTALFCYIFIALFLFSDSMVISRIKGRNPVKGVFIYGLPMTALCVTFGVYELCRMQREGFNNAAMLNAFMMIALGLYALSFILELFSNVYTKDDLEIVDSMPDEKEDSFKNNGAKQASTDGVAAPVNSAEKKTEDEGNAAAGQNNMTVDELVFSERTADYEPDEKTVRQYFDSADGAKDYILGTDYSREENTDAQPESPVPAETPLSKKELKRQEKEARKAAKKAEAARKAAEKQQQEVTQAAVAPQHQIFPEEPSVGEILNANIKQSRSADKRNSVDMGKLSEELRRAAESGRTNASEPNQFGDTVQDPSKREKAHNAARIAAELAEAKLAEEKRLAEEARQAEEARLIEETRKANEARLTAEKRMAEEAALAAEEERRAEEIRRAADELRKAEEAKRAEEARKVEEARRAEEARLAEEARKAEEARRAEEARLAEEARKAEEARRAAEEARKAEEARRAEEARKAEEARRVEEARRAAEEARKAEEARLAAAKARKEAAQAHPSTGNIGTREAIYREKRSALDDLLKNLGDKK